MPQRDGERMKILYEGGSAEITEKKSRFIATVRPVHSEEEAAVFLAEMRKKYWDARHNCSAFVVGDRMQLQRCSDDGEPQGTAGKPMLEVLTGAGLHYAAAVVTRYFGGTLLGTGGLVRSYTQAVKAALENAEIVTVTRGVLLRYKVTYQQAGKLQYVYAKENLPTPEMEYGQDVVMSVLMPAGEAERIKKATVQATDGKAELLLARELEYRIVDGVVERESF